MAEKPNHDSNCAKTRKANSRPERVALLKRRKTKGSRGGLRKVPPQEARLIPEPGNPPPRERWRVP